MITRLVNMHKGKILKQNAQNKISKNYDLLTSQVKSKYLNQFILLQIRVNILYLKN